MTMPSNPQDPGYRERLKWHLQRVDAWIGNADTKGSILLALNGVLVAAVLAVAPEVVSKFLEQGFWGKGISILFGLSGLGSMVFASWSILPVIGRKSWFSTLFSVLCREPLRISKPGNEKGSLFHFADVAQLGSVDNFRAAYRGITATDELEHLEHQVFVNSEIATRKFMRLTVSVGFLIVAVLLGLAAMVFHNIVIVTQ